MKWHASRRTILLEAWRDLVESPTGETIDCGHFIPEESPQETLRALRAFFSA